MSKRRSPRDANQRRRKRLSSPKPSGQNPSLPAPPPESPRARELATKLRGELAELAFFYIAFKYGFIVSKPYGDSQRYDFLLDSGKTIYRVQVKCSTALLNGQYHINAHRRVNGRAVPYTLDEVDFIVAYIVPEDSWFILPLSHVLGITSLLFRPKRSRLTGLYDPYREAWHLLRQPDGLEIL